MKGGRTKREEKYVKYRRVKGGREERKKGKEGAEDVRRGGDKKEREEKLPLRSHIFPALTRPNW